MNKIDINDQWKQLSLQPCDQISSQGSIIDLFRVHYEGTLYAVCFTAP